MKIKKTYNGVVPNGKVLNKDSSSVTDTYSCDYINNNVGIVESGSNENGSYIKYEDGTMICTMKKTCNWDMTKGTQWGSLYVWNNNDYIYFSKSFINIPIVNISIFQTTEDASCFMINYSKPIIEKKFLMNVSVARPTLSTNNNVNVDFHITAIGRWK